MSVTDISVTAAYVKGIKELSGEAYDNADVNADEAVTVADISKIAAHVKGIKLL